MCLFLAELRVKRRPSSYLSTMRFFVAIDHPFILHPDVWESKTLNKMWFRLEVEKVRCQDIDASHTHTSAKKSKGMCIVPGFDGIMPCGHHYTLN